MNAHASAAWPLTTREIPNLRGVVAAWRAEGARIGFVPTMGALHEGHLALVREAKRHCDHVVVSIFVNPTQFGPNEDFSRYPRTPEEDTTLLSTVGADLVWLPGVEDIYPTGSRTRVTVGDAATVLCGGHRPGHFDGVATVVTILLNAVRPDAAFFGEKDYQQLYIIRRMVADLGLPGEIHGVPTVREADGLALSSRNRYLSEEERATAPLLHQIMQKIARESADASQLHAALEEGRQTLKAAGFTVDYLEARDERTLTPLTAPSLHGRLFVAARLGTTRLIDNLALKDAL
jgi:pantoate--beta-alanine ligase